MLRDKIPVKLADEHDKVDSISERNTNVLEHFFFDSETAEFTRNISNHRAFQFFEFVGSFTSELFKVVSESFSKLLLSKNFNSYSFLRCV